MVGEIGVNGCSSVVEFMRHVRDEYMFAARLTLRQCPADSRLRMHICHWPRCSHPPSPFYGARALSSSSNHQHQLHAHLSFHVDLSSCSSGHVHPDISKLCLEIVIVAYETRSCLASIRSWLRPALALQSSASQEPREAARGVDTLPQPF